MSTIFYGYETSSKNLGNAISILREMYINGVKVGLTSPLNQCGASFYQVSPRKVFIHIFGLNGRGSNFGDVKIKDEKYIKNVSYNNQCDIPKEDEKNGQYVDNMIVENRILITYFNSGWETYAGYKSIEKDFRTWEVFLSNGIFGIQLDFKTNYDLYFKIGIIDASRSKYMSSDFFKYINEKEKLNLHYPNEENLIHKGFSRGLEVSFIDESLMTLKTNETLLKTNNFITKDWIQQDYNFEKYLNYYAENVGFNDIKYLKRKETFINELKKKFNVGDYIGNIKKTLFNEENDELRKYLFSIIKISIEHKIKEAKETINKYKEIGDIDYFKKENIEKKIGFQNFDKEILKSIIDVFKMKSKPLEGNEWYEKEYKFINEIDQFDIWKEFIKNH